MDINTTRALQSEYDAVIVGAGFAGLYMLHRLRGLGLSVRVFEAGSGVGGTWYWNRYPGARCDVESMEYSYQFSDELQQEWEWTERYASQPEILSYLNHVADRFDLRRDIQFDTRVEALTFDENASKWTVKLDDRKEAAARFCVLATGCLSSPNLPEIKGMESFKGATFHTAKWPHEGVHFDGQRVGVIGTGSSGVQSIPIIAEEAAQLFVFQRTPVYTVPAHNKPLDPDYVAHVKADYRGFRQESWFHPFTFHAEMNDASALDADEAERRRVYDRYWKTGGLPFMASFNDLFFKMEANNTAGEYIRSKIREIVHDPVVAEKLSPDQTFACKRLCVDSGYYDTFNRPNVTLVDLNDEPIEEIVETGIRTSKQTYALDSIVFATGFDAMTGAILKIDITGRNGAKMRDAWAEGPRTYLGLNVAGFPNLFTITGPGSPSVLSNMVPSIEQHVNWITDCIGYMGEHGYTQIEAKPAAQDAWVEHVNSVAAVTLFPSCNSWYLGANVPGKPRVFMPYYGFQPYVQKCDEVAEKDYEGFSLTA
jgi:cation diffusion facilitator CzcD-associated flavoprotein CzcO